MIETVSCSLFLVAVTLTGYGALWLIDRKQICDAAEKIALSFPAGLAAAGALLYTLNVLGLPFDRTLVLSVLVAGVLLGLIAAISSREAVRVSLERLRQRPFQPGLAGAICLAVAVCIILGFMARTLTQVNHLQDTELYHFPYAAIVFRTHHQPVYASQSMSEEFSFPPAIFVSYAALWACLGHINQLLPNLFPVPILFSWGLLTLLAVRRIFHGSDRAAAIACLLMAATYELEIMAAGESADLLPVALGTGAAYLLARDVAEGKNRRLILAAWLLGLNCWVKYQGIPYAACAAVVLLMSQSGHGSLKSRSRSVRILWTEARAPLTLFAGAVLIILPFLLRNFHVFGSPIYPGSLGPFHGVHSSPWSVRIVGGFWQPKLFYRFPDILARAIREPAVLLGASALALAYRRQHRPAIFLGWVALLFLILFLATMNSDFPSALRFAGASLAILSWSGGWLAAELEVCPPKIVRTIFAVCGALILVALLIAPFDPVLLQSSSWSGQVVNLWWIVPYGIGLGLLSRPQVSVNNPGIPGYWTALVVGAVALIHHQPFPDLRNFGSDIHRTNWAAAPAASDVVQWMQEHVPQRPDSAPVTYTYYTGRWALPGALLPADDPLLEPIHQPGVTVPAALERLRQLGAQYVLDWKATPLDNYQPFQTDPVIKNLSDTRYFKLLRKDNISALYRILYPSGEEPRTPGASNPMPWLLFAASGPRANR